MSNLSAPPHAADVVQALGHAPEGRVTLTREALVVARWPLGGIRTHLAYNAPALMEAGFRCTFVGPADDSLATLEKTLGHLPGARFVAAPVKGKSCRLWPTVREQLRSGRFSLVHSHGMIAGVSVAAANLGVGVPHVCTFHDPLRDDHFVGLNGRVKRWVVEQVVRRIDTLVCICDDIRDNLAEYLPGVRRGPCRLVTIPNGIDTSAYAAPSEGARTLLGMNSGSVRGELGLEPDCVLLGFLGRFMEQKGFIPLLGALRRVLDRGPGAQVRPFHLLAVGSGDRQREYAREVERRGLAGHVTFRPFTPHVAPLLRQLDLLVVPSLWEACPLLPMEALCAGVPVLGTDCIGLREVLRDTPARVVRAGDEVDLARGLVEALGCLGTEEARVYSREARDRFDNEPSARKLAQLYGGQASRR